MKSKFKYLIIILLSIFSFYYTDKIIIESKRKDPLMDMIVEKQKDSYIKPVNAIIDNDTMLVGKSGSSINTLESYEKMKEVNEYNESLLEYKKIKPSIIKDNNYDKSITGVVTDNKELSIIFVINNIESLEKIFKIFKDKNAYPTVFIDGKIIESNISKISDMNINLGIYSYNSIYNKQSIKYLKQLLSPLNNSLYCLYKDDNYLKACKDLKINTIKPYYIDKDIYNFFKNDKEKGKIYQIEVTKYNITEIDLSINYLLQKGYKIKTLSALLEE